MAFLAPVAIGIGTAFGFTGTAAAIAGTATLAAGAGFAGAKLVGKQSPLAAPTIQPAPKTPSPGDSAKKAKEEVNRRRKILQATGGKTNFTTPLGATVPEENIKRPGLTPTLG